MKKGFYFVAGSLFTGLLLLTATHFAGIASALTVSAGHVTVAPDKPQPPNTTPSSTNSASSSTTSDGAVTVSTMSANMAPGTSQLNESTDAQSQENPAKGDSHGKGHHKGHNKAHDDGQGDGEGGNQGGDNEGD